MKQTETLEAAPVVAEQNLGKNYKLWYDEELKALRIKIIAMLTKEDAKILLPLVNKRLKDKPHRYLVVDLSDIPIQQMLDKESRLAFRNAASEPGDYDKVAIFGAIPVVRMLARIILVVTGVSKVTRFFAGSKDALAWIKGKES